MRVVAWAPNHLGDGVMAMPALHALGRAHDVVVVAPRWGSVLYRDLPVAVRPAGERPPGDVGVLFGPSLRQAMEARHLSRRVGVSWDGRLPLLTDVVPHGPHQRDTYRGLAERLGVAVSGAPRFLLRDEERVTAVPSGHVGLNPVARGGSSRHWPGFGALADALSRPVVFYGGPGEQEEVAAVAGRHRTQVGLSLVRFAAALQRCDRFVTVDTGAAHFAAACGARVVVLHTSTRSRQTGTQGAVAIEGPPLRCRPCYRSTCRRWTRHNACQDIPVSTVLRWVEHG